MLPKAFAICLVPILWASTAYGGQAKHVFISSPSALVPYGDYAPKENGEPGNLVRDVLSCGFDKIEIVVQPELTDGGFFGVRVGKGRFLEAAMPCLKARLPEDFKITDDGTVEE